MYYFVVYCVGEPVPLVALSHAFRELMCARSRLRTDHHLLSKGFGFSDSEYAKYSEISAAVSLKMVLCIAMSHKMSPRP